MSTTVVSKAQRARTRQERTSRPGVGARRYVGHSPAAQMWRPGAPGGRPLQPAGPLYSVACGGAAIQAQAVRFATTDHARGRWTLSERGLVVMMIGFAMAILLGAVVVVQQYLALGVVG